MNSKKWYFIAGVALAGVILLAGIYLILRTTGVLYNLTPEAKKWIEYEG